MASEVRSSCRDLAVRDDLSDDHIDLRADRGQRRLLDPVRDGQDLRKLAADGLSSSSGHLWFALPAAGEAGRPYRGGRRIHNPPPGRPDCREGLGLHLVLGRMPQSRRVYAVIRYPQYAGILTVGVARIMFALYVTFTRRQ